MAVTPNSIVSPQTPFMKTAVATTAETAFGAPTNAVTLIDDVTQNSNGIRITSIYAISRSAIVGGALNCQIYKKSGSTYTLIDSALMALGTPSASVANQKIDFGYSEIGPLLLEQNVGLAVAIGSSISGGIVFVAKGGAY